MSNQGTMTMSHDKNYKNIRTFGFTRTGVNPDTEVYLKSTRLTTNSSVELTLSDVDEEFIYIQRLIATRLLRSTDIPTASFDSDITWANKDKDLESDINEGMGDFESEEFATRIEEIMTTSPNITIVTKENLVASMNEARGDSVWQGGGGSPNQAPDVSATVVLPVGNPDVAKNITMVQLLANSTDPDGDTLSVLNLAANQAGLTGTTPTWSLTPPTGFIGVITLTYDVSDGTTTTPGTATVQVIAIIVPAVITNHPVSKSTVEGNNATFTVTATNANSYQWYLNGNAIGGATAASYTVLNPQLAMSGDVYKVDAIGDTTVTSNNATLTVSSVPLVDPVITSQPASVAVNEGASATFTVTANFATAYQWFLNGSEINGATSASYTIGTASVPMSGDVYRVDAIGDTTVTSNNATLTVNALPVITSHPQSKSVEEGTATSFSVTALNATSYQWYLDDVVINGAISATYNIANALLASTGGVFKVDVIGVTTITSNNATLTVTAAVVANSLLQWSGDIVMADDNVLRSLEPAGAIPTYLSGPFNVFLQDGSVSTGGIFDEAGVVINDPDATWVVISETPLDGSFNFYDGGAFTYVSGAQTGTASFSYRVTDGVDSADGTKTLIIG